MKTSIREIDINQKKVIIRVDFNVPIKDGVITDDNRIVESLKTIKYAIDHNAKVILMSHLGRIKEESDKEKNSLKVVAEKLSEYLEKEVKFVPFTRGKELEEAVENLKNGEVLLMENTRFEDIPEKSESKNNQELATYWASLGDVFINDAFGTSHRNHASNVGIATYLPSGVGFLIEKELLAMTNVENPEHPFVVILGGSKVNDKIKVIENLVLKADYILIGGGMANTFLTALGYEMGKSLTDLESIPFCKDMLKKYPDKIILPVDVAGANEISENVSREEYDLLNIPSYFIALDVGEKTIEKYYEYLEKAKVVVWNGPLGMFELPNFALGTKKIASFCANINRTVIIGGGDTAAAVINLGFKDKFTHISTGGGATLQMLEGSPMPGIDIIK